MIVCLPISTVSLSVPRTGLFYGVILPERSSRPLLCVGNSIFITNPKSKMGSAYLGEPVWVIAKWRDWFSLLTTLLDEIVLWPPLGSTCCSIMFDYERELEIVPDSWPVTLYVRKTE